MVKQSNQGNGLIGFVAGLCSPSQNRTRLGGGGDEIATSHVVMTRGCATCIAFSLQLRAPTPHSPRRLDAAPGPSPSKEDGTSQCHMCILDKKYLYSPSQAHECLFCDDRHEIDSMCRHLQCTSCIAAITFVLGSVEFTL